MSVMYQPGRAGVFVRQYRQQDNLNAFVNRLMREEVKAFPPSAIITQIKRFPDGSYYQGQIDFDVLCSKTDAVIFRAGQNTWADSMFLHNYAEAKRRGMKRGLYWFYDDRADPGKQVAKLLEMIGDDLPEMEIFWDWENTYGGAFGGLRNVVAAMQATERALPTVKVGIYTGFYWFIEHSNAIANYAQYQYLKDKPLWLGYYAEAEFVKIPAPWTTLTHWQYGTPAEYWGQASYEIDMNYFNGTEQEFEVRYGGTVPQEEQTMARYTIKTPSTNSIALRPDHNTNNAPHLYIPANTTLETDAEPFVATQQLSNPSGAYQTIGDTWAQVTYGGKTGWVAVIHKGAHLCTLTENNPAPTDPEYIVAYWADGHSQKYIPE